MISGERIASVNQPINSVSAAFGVLAGATTPNQTSISKSL